MAGAFINDIFGEDLRDRDNFVLQLTDHEYTRSRRGYEARYYGLPIFKVNVLSTDIIQSAPHKCFIYEVSTGCLFHKHPDGHVSGEFASNTIRERVGEIDFLMDDVEFRIRHHRNRFMDSFKFETMASKPVEAELEDDVGGALDEFLKEFEVIKVE